MSEQMIQQRKAAHREAQDSWISPRGLGLLFTIGLTLTVIFNGV
jgi:hypothetical protein